MKIGIAVFALCLCLSAPAYAQDAQPTPPGDVVKISTNLIQLDATVTDSKGNAIRDLTRDDFEIYENGRRQDLTGFSFVSSQQLKKGTSATARSATGVPVPPTEVRADKVRRAIALVVDDLSLSYGSMNKTRRSLKKFVEEQMSDGDLVAIIRVGVGMGALQQFTSDKNQLLANIEKLRWNPLGRGRIGSFEPINDGPESLQKADMDEEDLAFARNNKIAFDDFRESIFAQGTLGAMRYVIGGLAQLPGRKSVVLLSDGIQIFQRDEHGYTNGGRVNEFLRVLIDMANRSSVVIYTMDMRGLDDGVVTAQDSIYPSRPPTNTRRLTEVAADRTKELFDTQDGLVHLAEQTGGFPILFQNDVNAGLSKILEDQSYYLLAYEPDAETFDKKTAQFNKIEIKVKRDGAKVRYRSGFFNNTTEAVAKPAKQTEAQRLQEALTSPFVANQIALRMNTLYANNKGADFIKAFLHIETKDLKFVDAPGGAKKAIVDVLGVTYGDNGVPVDRIARSFQLDVKPNDLQRVLSQGFVCFFNVPIKKAGPYQFRVAIRDPHGDTIGSASQFIQVPDLKSKALSLSGIVLENFTPQQWQQLADVTRQVSDKKGEDAGATGDSMTDTSLRRFRRGTILHYTFDIYNSSVRNPLNSRLRVFRDGVLLLDGKPVPVEPAAGESAGSVRSTGAMMLPAEMAPGDYILQVIISDGSSKGRTVAQFIQFELL